MRWYSSELLGATEDLYLLWVWCWKYCLFVYLHFVDCLHVLLSVLILPLRFVPTNHREFSLPSSAWKSLEKAVVYKAASGKAVNQLASDWSWAHLNIRPALWLEVGPLWKARGILQYKILPRGSPCVNFVPWQNASVCQRPTLYCSKV